MTVVEIQSEAFSLAALRSERIRILGLLVAMAALLVLVVVRALILGDAALVQQLPQVTALLLFVIAYEAVILLIVKRALRMTQELSTRFFVLNLFIETLFPSLAILILTASTTMGAYQALLAPAGLTYFYFILLSTLRLNPLLAQLTGLFSTLGYLIVTAYTFWQYPDPEGVLPRFGVEIYLTYAALILVGGFIAAAVTAQIRTHVAAALEEAETRSKLEHDLGIARSIQQGLLPQQMPEIDGYEIAAWNQPADETGGDYFDWQLMPDGRVVLSLGDVTGHGIGPALVTAACRAYARASFSSDTDLGNVTGRINKLLFEDLPTERFVTFVVALLEPGKAGVQLLSAGHGPLLLYRLAEDRVESFGAHGIPLGLMAPMGYGPTQHIIMSPGDILVLITDGFFEWANLQDEEFGIERVQEVIRSARELPPEEIISSLYREVLRFANGTVQADDLTAVVVKRKEEPI